MGNDRNNSKSNGSRNNSKSAVPSARKQQKESVENLKTLPVWPRSWDYQQRFVAEFKLEFCGVPVTIEQNPKLLGATVWDAAIVLCKYLDNEQNYPPNYFLNKRVIDIGSGTGLVGIILALLGADVVVTDMPEYIDLMNRNIQRNSPELLRRIVRRNLSSRTTAGGGCVVTMAGQQATVSQQIRADELWWGSDVSRFNPPFDYVFASDVVYNEYVKDLIKSLWDLSDENTTIYVSYEERNMDQGTEFFTLMPKYFDATFVDKSKFHPFFQTEAICIMILKKKKQETQESAQEEDKQQQQQLQQQQQIKSDGDADNNTSRERE